MRSDHRIEDEVEKPKLKKERELYAHPDKGQPELCIERDGDFDAWTVWLNTGIANYDGLVIGTGETRQAAIEDAYRVAEWIAETLNQPSPEAMKRITSFQRALSNGIVSATLRVDKRPCNPTKRFVRFDGHEWQEADVVEGPWLRVVDQVDAGRGRRVPWMESGVTREVTPD